MSFISQPQEDFGLPIKAAPPSILSHMRTASNISKSEMASDNITRWSSLSGHKPHPLDLSPEEANEQFGIDGHVSFEAPVSSYKARLIHDYKVAELERNALMEAGDTSLLRKIAFFGGGLTAEFRDPINVAAMLIPGLGQAKMAKLTSKFGKVGAAVIAQGADSLVGAVAVEPFSYLSKAAGEQNEYGAVDTAMNVTLGTALGLGLRLGGLGASSVFWKSKVGQEFSARAKGKTAQLQLSKLDSDIVNRVFEAAKKKKLVPESVEWKNFVSEKFQIEQAMYKAEREMLVANMKGRSSATQKAALEESLNNLLNDEPNTGPGVVLKLDAFNTIHNEMYDNWVRVREDIIVVTEAIKEEAPGRRVDPETGKDIPEAKVATDVAQSAELNGSKVRFIEEPDTIHASIDTRAEPADVQALIYDLAERAYMSDRRLIVTENGTATVLEGDVLRGFVKGIDSLAETPETKVPGSPSKPKPKTTPSIDAENVWDAIAAPESLQPKATTPLGIIAETLKTAEDYTKSADEIRAQLIEMVGKKNLKKLGAIAEKTGKDPIAIAKVLEADPTPNKKFRNWLLEMEDKKVLKFPEDTEKTKKRLEQFEKLSKKALFTDEKDLNKYKSFSELAETLDKYLEDAPAVSVQERIRKAGKGGRVVVKPTKSNPLTVTEATTVEACKVLGDGTDWCTTGDAMARSYLGLSSEPAVAQEELTALFKIIGIGRENASDAALKWEDYEGALTEYLLGKVKGKPLSEEQVVRRMQNLNARQGQTLEDIVEETMLRFKEAYDEGGTSAVLERRVLDENELVGKGLSREAVSEAQPMREAMQAVAEEPGKVHPDDTPITEAEYTWLKEQLAEASEPRRHDGAPDIATEIGILSELLEEGMTLNKLLKEYNKKSKRVNAKARPLYQVFDAEGRPLAQFTDTDLKTRTDGSFTIDPVEGRVAELQQEADLLFEKHGSTYLDPDAADIEAASILSDQGEYSRNGELDEEMLYTLTERIRVGGYDLDKPTLLRLDQAELLADAIRKSGVDSSEAGETRLLLTRIEDVRADQAEAKVAKQRLDAEVEAKKPKPKPDEPAAKPDEPAAKPDEPAAKPDEPKKSKADKDLEDDFEKSTKEQFEKQAEEFEQILETLDIPEDAKQKMRDDFDQPNQLERVKTGIMTAADCVIENLAPGVI